MLIFMKRVYPKFYLGWIMKIEVGRICFASTVEKNRNLRRWKDFVYLIVEQTSSWLQRLMDRGIVSSDIYHKAFPFLLLGIKIIVARALELRSCLRIEDFK